MWEESRKRFTYHDIGQTVKNLKEKYGIVIEKQKHDKRKSILYHRNSVDENIELKFKLLGIKH